MVTSSICVCVFVDIQCFVYKKRIVYERQKEAISHMDCHLMAMSI